MAKIAIIESKKDTKANKIKNVTFDLFAKCGYHQTTMSDIVRAASVGHGTLIDRLSLAMEELPRSLAKHGNLIHAVLEAWGKES